MNQHSPSTSTARNSELTGGLTDAQARGLLRLGDVLIPGDDVLPRFSDAVAPSEIARMLPYMHESDRSSLLLLLASCSRLPKPAIKALVASAAGWRRAPEPAAALLRMANIGIKGVVHSLYWSDLRAAGIHATIGYDAKVDEAAYERTLTITPTTPQEGEDPTCACNETSQ